MFVLNFEREPPIRTDVLREEPGVPNSVLIGHCKVSGSGGSWYERGHCS